MLRLWPASWLACMAILVVTVKFTGLIGRKALKPGSYRATATAKDAAGNVSKPSVVSFTIAAR